MMMYVIFKVKDLMMTNINIEFPQGETTRSTTG